MISGSASVRATRAQVSNTVEGEAVILNLAEGAYYGLDPVGTRVWSLIQEPRRVADICNAIAEEYGVERDRCERDVVALLEDLVANGLAEIRE